MISSFILIRGCALIPGPVQAVQALSLPRRRPCPITRAYDYQAPMGMANLNNMIQLRVLNTRTITRVFCLVIWISTGRARLLRILQFKPERSHSSR
jgi:hypothetical protein